MANTLTAKPTETLPAMTKPELEKLEKQVKEGLKSFMAVGQALMEIRERRGYLVRGYASFPEYCEKELGITERHGFRLMDGFQTAQQVKKIVGEAPRNESVARVLKPIAGEPKLVEKVADRLNAAFGARAGAEARKIDSLDTFLCEGALSVVVGAVDNPAARSVIGRAVKKANGSLWWLDAGNENHSGQVALGNVAAAKDLAGAVALGMTDRLPCPTLVYPDLVKTPRARRTARKQSCAELTASGEQSLMINRLMASYTLALLYDFLVAREVRYFAVAVDAQWAGTRAYALDVPTLAQVTGLPTDQLVSRAQNARSR